MAERDTAPIHARVPIKILTEMEAEWKSGFVNKTRFLGHILTLGWAAYQKAQKKGTSRDS